MKKTVVVAQDFSLPRTSICGIPEGCPFSVAAAVMIGAHLNARSDATALIYIDNIVILSKDAQEIHQATSLALRFFEAWAFRIDRNRSWSWTASDPQKHKDAATFEIVAARLNLGSFQRYRKLTRHGHLAVRLREGIARAKCIAALPLDGKARLQAINAGPMQVALYGSEVSYVGDQPIQGMPQCNFQNLCVPQPRHKSSCSPRTVESMTPRFTSFCGPYEPLRERIGNFCTNMKTLPSRCLQVVAWGPASALAAYFTSISIEYDRHGYISLAEHGPRVHIFHSGFSDVEPIVLQAWYNKTVPARIQMLHSPAAP